MNHQSAGSDQKKDARFSPVVSLPKGGGAIQLWRKVCRQSCHWHRFTNDPSPAESRPRRVHAGAGAFVYDSGAGNGPFGLGWSIGYPAISRRTDRGLPRYLDDGESDVFLLSGAEDLVPVLNADGSLFEEERDGYRIRRYRPRIESRSHASTAASHAIDRTDVYWRSISRDNVTTFYGRTK